MSSTGTTTCRSSSFATPASTSWIGRAPETKRPISSSGRCVAERPMRCTGVLDEPVEALDAQREVRAALRARDRVHLVEDQRADAAQHLARLRREQEIERLGRRDQDVRVLAEHRLALLLRRVARADADAQVGLDARQRAAQVPFDVVVERLQRRDVEQPQSLARALLGQPVDPVEEGRERLARAGRRLDQRVLRRRRSPASRAPAPGWARRTPARTRYACAR